jgi:uncharacterized protein (TIGR00297 family)
MTPLKAADELKMAAQVSVNRFTSSFPIADSGSRTVAGYDGNVEQERLQGESKLVLLLVLPYTAASVVFQTRNWAMAASSVAIWAVGLSLLLGLVAWKMRSATPAAALTGAVINASLMFSTFVYPYKPWETAMIAVLAVMVLTALATKYGRRRKEHLGTAEKRHGRAAAQVAANLGMAALVSDPAVHSWMLETVHAHGNGVGFFAVGLAALVEAAADTVSSEVGQVLGGRPIMITTLRRIEPGMDGAISLAGTLAGFVAGGVVAVTGSLALHGGARMFVVSWAGGVFGLFFDSLLGATLERSGWLNNDAVNFLSTASAAGFSLGLLAMFPRLGAV